MKFHGEDGQVSGTGYFPTGDADLAYTFAADGSYTITSTNPGGLHPNIPADQNVMNPDYVWYTGGTYNTSTGESLTETDPVLYTQAEVDNIVNNQDFDTMMSKSFVGYYPSDWAQRLARQLANAAEGDTATMTVTLMAKGKLPSLLGMVSGDSMITDPQNNRLRAETTVTATRLANGTVNGVANACRFSYTMLRPMSVPNIVELEKATPGGSYTSSDTALQNATDSKVFFLGQDLEELDTIDKRLGFEVYIPVIEGTFATSNQVPFFTVETIMNHVYGVSSPAAPHITYSNFGDMLAEKAVDRADGSDYLHMPAMQRWRYQP